MNTSLVGFWFLLVGALCLFFAGAMAVASDEWLLAGMFALGAIASGLAATRIRHQEL